MTGALQVVVMGVSGTGKSEVGSRVADRLSMTYVEGDAHHPAANIAKMSAGTPLTDDDRRPWLEELAGILADHAARGIPTVLGCSALRRTYRDLLRGDQPPGSVAFLHLVADVDVLDARMRRREHFMPATLLRSQLDTLEPLEPDEPGVAIDVDAPLDLVVDRGVEAVRGLR
ncbi:MULTISPECIES: gluconokinase [unclassified Aeromicrobium]|uniref:gluconokinase n=1 Tax=unclassified Aeromicrobium TaxID=2633570 RepID=UPI0006F24DF0|nr:MULTISPECIES: gluconokinase [unclassified Aeromicrobium]KQO38931.1 hypothetical protein ASF05_03365 [Aeromicrobium sp. Leaf245]KQP25678.1 hypothetical protein ASF38_14615 [Aeromicrobium sp. Leaf272]KQP79715.1 hypothetical protein ASF37_01500 [Aeromicrobium sp. Leaf289]KQP82193.1 hypothetical protein ASF35_12175 [Aeromicrobium sp. Leaf291]